jgi:hypothetical protein
MWGILCFESTTDHEMQVLETKATKVNAHGKRVQFLRPFNQTLSSSYKCLYLISSLSL